jgi:ABC-type transport system substrate-binding protein
MRLRRLGALLTVLGVLTSAVLLAHAAPKPGGTLKVALLRDPTGWDPHLNYGATTYTF